MGNQKLENMLDEMRARTSEKKLPDDFIAMLKESDVIVPAIMPAGTDPEILHKLMEYSDKNMGLPPEANPQPCVLQNPGRTEIFTGIYIRRAGAECTERIKISTFDDNAICILLTTFKANRGIKRYCSQSVFP